MLLVRRGHGRVFQHTEHVILLANGFKQKGPIVGSGGPCSHLSSPHMTTFGFVG